MVNTCGQRYRTDSVGAMVLAPVIGTSEQLLASAPQGAPAPSLCGPVGQSCDRLQVRQQQFSAALAAFEEEDLLLDVRRQVNEAQDLADARSGDLAQAS